MSGADSAVEAELVYASDTAPGIRRRRRGNGFSYHRDTGESVSAAERRRINDLAIPPAWTDVWISPDPRGHILATGRDAAGRKQYRYHPDWEKVRDEAKFERLGEFGQTLTGLRRRLAEDMGAGRPDRDRVVALAVAVVDRTLVRIGNHRYTEQNNSFGLTTLTTDQVDVNGAAALFAFPGKGGAEVEVELADRELSRLISQCQDLAGQTLFSYQDGEGNLRSVTSDDVNKYLRQATGGDFSAKDFRTWGASAIVAGCLGGSDPDDGDSEVLGAVDTAAESLGNSREVCRDAYVHPGVIEAFVTGELGEAWAKTRRSKYMSRPERTLLRLVAGS